MRYCNQSVYGVYGVYGVCVPLRYSLGPDSYWEWNWIKVNDELQNISGAKLL